MTQSGEKRLQGYVDGDPSEYFIRTEVNEYPTLIRSWGRSGSTRRFSVIDTFGSVSDLETVTKTHLKRLRARGFRVVQDSPPLSHPADDREATV